MGIFLHTGAGSAGSGNLPQNSVPSPGYLPGSAFGGKGAGIRNDAEIAA